MLVYFRARSAGDGRGAARRPSGARAPARPAACGWSGAARCRWSSSACSCRVGEEDACGRPAWPRRCWRWSRWPCSPSSGSASHARRGERCAGERGGHRLRAGARAGARRLAIRRDDCVGGWRSGCGATRRRASRSCSAIPAILAAAASEGLPLLKVGLGRDEAWLFAVGVLVSAVVGYLTVKYFLRFLAVTRSTRSPGTGLALAALFVTWLARRFAMMHWLRRSFIAGFFVTVPLVISVAALVWIFRLIDGLVGPFYARLAGPAGPGARHPDDRAAVLLVVGAVATNVIGKRLLQRGESCCCACRCSARSTRRSSSWSSPSRRTTSTGSSASCRRGAAGAGRAGIPDQGVHRRAEGGARDAGGRLRADQSPVSRRRHHLPPRRGVAFPTSRWSRGSGSS